MAELNHEVGERSGSGREVRAHGPRAGGAATQAGTGYQNRVVAWIAVQILAEQATSPSWDLPASVTLELLRCETDQPVDDVLVGTSDAGFGFGQAKHSLNLEASPRSDLASAIDQ